MIPFDLGKNENLQRAYLFANTPAYLYRQLRSDPAVQSLARQHTLQDLIQFGAKASQSDRRLESRVGAYAVLVAATLRAETEPGSIVLGTEFSQLDWANEIVLLWNSGRIVTQHVSFDITPKPTAIITDLSGSAPEKSAKLWTVRK